MLTQILFFVIISAGSLLGIIREECSYERVLPVTCISYIFLLYLFGLFNRLELGFYIILIINGLAYLSFVVYSVRYIREKSFSTLFAKLRRTVFTPSMIVFSLCFILLTYADYGYRVANWDELSHWALTVKQMTFYNVLGNSRQADIVVYKSYPPAMAIFQYLLQKIYLLTFNAPETVVSEWRLYFAYQTLSLAVVMPFTAKLDYKKVHTYFLWIVLFLSFIFVFDFAYTTIYIDPFLGCLSGTSLSAVFFLRGKRLQNGEDTYDILDKAYILLCIFLLVLTKDAGMLPAVFASLAYIYIYIYIVSWGCFKRSTAVADSRRCRYARADKAFMGVKP